MSAEKMHVGQLSPAMQLRPVAARSRVLFFVLMLMLPLIIIGVTQSRLIIEAPSTGFAYWVRALPFGVALLIIVVWWGIDRLLLRHTLTLDGDTLQIATTFYRRRLSIGQLDLEAARVIDLAEHTRFKPFLKTNGVGLPGFNSGWFRLRNWQSAFVATSDGPRVLLIPTTEDFTLILQPVQPQALLDELRKLAARRQAR